MIDRIKRQRLLNLIKRRIRWQHNYRIICDAFGENDPPLIVNWRGR